MGTPPRLLPSSALVLVSTLGLLAGCASIQTGETATAPLPQMETEAALNRMSWGVNSASYSQAKNIGLAAYVQRQLHPAPAILPQPIQEQINAMSISQKPMEQLVQEMEARRKTADGIMKDDDKKAAQQAYQQELNRLTREAGTRSLMLALYSPNQVQEQMTWFWFNHFNVHSGKANLRAMVGDYEQHAIREHALGKFRDLVAATVFHPAMLRYLDNEQNAANRINENYARELMELHTLGVDGGYSQKDVQELARILTGLGVNLGTTRPNVKKELDSQYVRNGLFEFNPNRHDYRDKEFLGATVKGRGLAEVNEAIDRLCKHPATARFVSKKMATFFVGDTPPQALVDRMAATFTQTDGDIAAVLQALFAAPEFAASLGHKFKDPVHYVVSAVRLAYDDKPILNAGPMIYWLQRMGEPLYGRQTPDGYSMVDSAWASPGQMTTRFEIAKAIGSGSAGLFKTDGDKPVEKPAFPQLNNALYYHAIQARLAPATKAALEQAGSPQEWNTFLLASPDMMNR